MQDAASRFNQWQSMYAMIPKNSMRCYQT